MSEVALKRELAAGLDTLQLDYSAEQLTLLLDYLQLLSKWNRAYNLTAVREPREMLRLHLLDSLSIASSLRGQSFIDVGTGAGLPGIPLAVLYPRRQFTLLDSNGKKARFIFQARNQLRLANVAEIQQRVELHRPERLYDGVISRAFASLRQMLQRCGHLVARGSRFYVMKGQYPEQELSELPKNYKVVAIRPLQVPGVDGDRHLIVIEEGF